MANKYNSKLTTLQLVLPNGDAVLPAITSGTDYTLDLESIYGKNYIQFDIANGASVSPLLGPTLPFDKEDRPILRNIRLVCSFADGMLFTTPQIETHLLINNIQSTGGGFNYVGINPLDRLTTNLPLQNTKIDIERFIPITFYDVAPSPVDFPDVTSVYQNCMFLFLRAFTFTWNTNSIDPSFNGLIPQFVVEAEIEHTFNLGAIGACNVV